jgi:uncharacterized membrane protein
MTLGRLAIAYGSSLIVFLLLDTGWITMVVLPMYKSELSSIMLDRPSLPSAIAFYLLYMVGLVYFAIAPGLRQESWTIALLNGALYGFFAYVTYSLTNLSVLRGWTNAIAASDIGWGVVVSGVTAVAATLITRWTVS